MALKLQDSKRDGSSIRVGSTGTISSLMNKELDSCTSLSSSSSAAAGPRLVPVSMSGNDSIFKLKKSMDEGQSSSMKQGSPESRSRRIRVMGPTTCKRIHRVPMLGSENTTPKRENPARKICLVEVVDTNCGVPSGYSLSNRLKKLSFSKLSHSLI